MRRILASLSLVILVGGCGGDEPRLAPVLDSETINSEPVVTPPVAAPVETAEPSSGDMSNESGAGGANDDPLADLESSVLVPNVVLNFTRGSEDACVAALGLTADGKLSTPGFTYTDKTCRRLIDSIPVPNLPENDIETAYLRGFQEMLSIMFRPGELCASNGECFVKEDVLPVMP
jgi:hypothetical protein